MDEDAAKRFSNFVGERLNADVAKL